MFRSYISMSIFSSMVFKYRCMSIAGTGQFQQKNIYLYLRKANVLIELISKEGLD